MTFWSYISDLVIFISFSIKKNKGGVHFLFLISWLQDEEIEALLGADFEIGHFIRERIIPRAVLFFTGEAIENEEVSHACVKKKKKGTAQLYGSKQIFYLLFIKIMLVLND